MGGLVSFAAFVWDRHAMLPPEGVLRDNPKQPLRRRLWEVGMHKTDCIFKLPFSSALALSLLLAGGGLAQEMKGSKNKGIPVFQPSCMQS